MKHRQTAFFFIIIVFALPAFSQDSKKSDFFFKRKFDSEFYLQSTYSVGGGYNFTGYKNYPLAKLNIDIVEAWFGRLGVSSVIGATFGLSPAEPNVLISQLVCPGVNVSWDIGLGLSASLGINMLHNWHYFKENTTIDTATLSGSTLKRTKSEIQTATTLRSYGLSVPVRIRYAFTRNISAYAEYVFSAHPWIKDSNEKNRNWIVENTLTAGVSFSVPIRI